MTEFHAGELIGEYRLEGRLGQGGFGTVFRARHIGSGRVVALKVLPENETTLDNASLRAEVELLAASAAGASPHIVQVLDGGISPVPYVVMEFVNGSSLAEELKSRGKLSQAEVIDVGLGIARALEALETGGIVHRDVKPSNVLIDRGGTVKLSDFGIAKIAGYDAVTVTGQLPLSIAYAAPEVWEGKAEHRSDLYALGVLLYQCLTGTLPFRGAYAELFYQHRSQEPDLTALPPGTAQSLVDLIGLCLRKEPADRPEGATTCHALLLRAKGELEVAVNEQETLVEPQKFGPWQKGEPHTRQPWAWLCRNAESGEQAVVELHFAATAGYGEVLRRAVAASPQLAPLGAERLLQTNRMILRPGEAWKEPPAGQFQFWVAREEIALPDPPLEVGAAALLGYTQSLQALLAQAAAAGIALRLDAETLFLLPDGSVHTRRPGLDVGYEGAPERDALAFLRSQPLGREVRPLVARATNLDALRVSLERLLALTAAGAAAPASTRDKRLRVLAGLAAAAAAVVVAAAVVLLTAEDEPPNETVAPPTPTIALPAAAAGCLALVLPAPLGAAEAACTTGTALEFDPSCPTGMACSRTTRGAVLIVGINDRAVAFIDPLGRLTLARENGTEALPLLRGDGVQEAAWSPDGRYLVYLARRPATGEAAAGAAPEATQLRIVEAGRPANDGLVLATNNLKDRTPANLQRLISSPRWSADGSRLYFLWSLSEKPGGELFSVELPRTPAGEVDFGRLRSDSLPEETSAQFNLAAVTISPAHFGIEDGYFNAVEVLTDGSLLLQVCQGAAASSNCSVGRWDGAGAGLLSPREPGLVFGLPVASPFDGVLHAPRFQNRTWTLVRIEAGGPAAVAGIALPGTNPLAPPRIAFDRGGDFLLFEAAQGQLSLVRYDGSAATPWGSGSAPAWFVARAASPGVPAVGTPPAVPYATPAATATPPATPTPPLQQMTLRITVLRNGAPVSGARVQALINGVECGALITSGSVTDLAFPHPNAPLGCRVPGNLVTFLVNSTPVSTTVPYQVGAILPVDLILP